jgi:ligand-binding sensor domain-containing protein
LLRTFLTFSFLFSIATALFSQQARQYAFKQFTVTNGLASNTVSDVKQDHDGYIWMATVNGLQRFDGNSFITFKNRRSDPGTIPSNHIIFIYEDRKKNLWLVGDNNRVGIFDTKKFLFREIPQELQIQTFQMPQRFTELQTGELLLITAEGSIQKYDEKQQRLVSAQNIIPMPHNWKCNSISWDSSIKKYWIGGDSGLVQYNPATKVINYRGHNTENDPAINALGNIVTAAGPFADAKGNVIFARWPPMGGWPVIHRYNRQTKKAEELSMVNMFGYHEINGFLQQANGRLWIYGHPFFAEWTNDKDQFVAISNEYKGEQDLKYGYAFGACEDREKNIWIATDNGVFYFNPDEQIFNSYKLITPGKAPIENSVTCMEELDDGRIVVGTWGYFLYCYDHNFKPVSLPKALQGQYLSSWDMAVNSRTHDLWITLQGGGVAVYNQKTGKFIKTFPEIFGSKTVRQVDEDTSGNLWFGTQGGRLIKWDLKKSGNDPTKGYELIYQTAGLIHKVHFDYQGYIWVATLGNGLLKFDVKTNKLLRTFSTKGKVGEQLFMDSPADMTWYNDSTLIVAAGCINVINTKTNKVRFISADEGLPSNTAECIQKDRSGILWVGMTNGICRVNLEKSIISYYDRRDGLSFDKFYTAGVTHLNDGKIVFFTERNFLAFDPTKFRRGSLPPKPYLTSFKLQGEPLSVDSLLKENRIILDYDNTSITIGFSALTYLQQRKVHYFYMLEGLDKDWIHVDRPMEAIYNSLPPGDYTFKVRSENGDGLISSDIVSIPVTIRPPFWKSWWFLSLVSLLIVLILYLIDRERVKRRTSLQQVRRQIRGNLKDEVSTTLNNINVLSEIAKIKADKNVDQAKDFIDQISDKSRYMMEVLDDTIWTIDPMNDNMQKFILRIKELTEGLRASHNAEIDLIVDHKVQSMELEMRLRYELLFYYKEAMHFILQNVCGRQIFVNINRSRSRLFIEILSECDSETAGLKNKFAQAVEKRIKNLDASMDVLADNKSFSAVMYMNTR